MKKFLISLMFLIGCGGSFGPDLDSFTVYTPKDSGKWAQKLEEFYGTELTLIHEVTWYYGERENVIANCSSERSAACVYGDGTIFMTDKWRESCLFGLHELMHLALLEVNGDSDSEHLSNDWGEVFDLCSEIKLNSL